MRPLFTKMLAVGLLSIGCVSIAYSQQAAPMNVMPPTPQKATISPTMTAVTPSDVSTPSPYRTDIAPQVPAAPVQTKPDLPLPASVGTNTVRAAVTGQPAQPSAPQGSSWAQTSAVQTSAWDKTSVSSAAKPAPDLWSKQPANSRIWDSSIPVNSTGTTTQWK